MMRLFLLFRRDAAAHAPLGCGPLAALLLGCSLAGWALAQETRDDPAQLAKDRRTVETLLRLKRVDPNENEKLKASVLRYLDSVRGTDRYVEVADELNMRDATPGLIDIAIEFSAENLGVDAARTVLKLDQLDALVDRLGDLPQEKQLSLIEALGGVGNRASTEQLLTWIEDTALERPLRQAAVRGLLRGQTGRNALAELIETDRLPEALTVTTAAAIDAANDPQLRARVADKLTLPETATAEPLPPLADLVAARGNIELGREAFLTKGTCANCHQIGGAGKEVGPDLSEIGSKLSREAMFVSILDPSAGVSHNYETYAVQTLDGELVSGILVSETDEAVTLKTSEALIREIPQEDIEQMQKQPVSLMPAGLQKNLSVDELVSLVDYLMTLTKDGAAPAEGSGS